MKHCDCSVTVCMCCFYRIKEAQEGTYSCPGCRGFPPPVKKLSEAQIVRARSNWIWSFDEQSGTQVVLDKLPVFPVQDRRALYEIINSGQFTMNRGAGVCLDREAARVFVAPQLHCLKETNSWPIQNKENNSDSDFNYDEAEMETVPQ